MAGECQSESDDAGGEMKDNLSSSACGYMIGLYGWRRRCLFFILILLLATVTINLALSLWLLKVLQLSQSGIGTMRVLSGGLQLDGEAMLLDKLVASKISSRPGQPVRMESSKSISLQSRNQEEETSCGRVTEKLVLEDGQLDVMASSIKISDPREKLLLAASEGNRITIGADSLRIAGEGGALIPGSVQVPTVRPHNGEHLKLESPTRSLKIFALHGIAVESQAGDIIANCQADIKMESKNKHVKLDTGSIYLPRIATAPKHSERKVVTPFSPSTAHYNLERNRGSKFKSGTVFQVCVCKQGRLFLAPPEGPCTANEDVCR